MIAYFGRYDQAVRWAKENQRPLRDVAIMPISVDKLHGTVEEIEVVFAGDWQPTPEAGQALEIIQMYNYQFTAMRQSDIEEAQRG